MLDSGENKINLKRFPNKVEEINSAQFQQQLQFKDNGLIPAIVQDADSQEVLMIAYMNAEAVKLTIESGEAWFYSRSRQEMWHKGATSGNRLIVKEMWQDCDSDAILVKAAPIGPVCHTGNRTCFFQSLQSKK